MHWCPDETSAVFAALGFWRIAWFKIGPWLRRLLFGGAILASCSLSGQAQIPLNATKYHAQLIREVHATWGLSGNVAAMGAQVMQESSWNPNARSAVGAQGLGQIMPLTGAWLSKTYPSELPAPAPFDPAWNLRALVKYDYWLYRRVEVFQTVDNNRLAAALSSYNAGLGWILKQYKNAAGCDGSIWFGCAENAPDGRTAANRAQSRDYPRRILLLYMPRFRAAGW